MKSISHIAFVLILSVFFATFADGRPLATFMASALPEPETLVYKRIGDEELKLQVFRPGAASLGDKRPAIVWIHGGAWVGGTTDGTAPHAAYFASRGMVAFNINYRLARPGGVTVGDCLADCRSALRYLRTHASDLGLDPDRIAVAGDSAGGHLAASLGTLSGFDNAGDDLSVSGRANAMILYNPIIDMTEGDWIRYAVGGRSLADKSSPRPTGPADLELARSLSPLFHVAPGQPPAIVLHGRADTVVPASQAERFAAASGSVGNRCDLVLYEGIGHAFVVAAYKSPEAVVVEAIRAADRFLGSLGWLEGSPQLTVSEPPAWLPKDRANIPCTAVSSPVNQVFQFMLKGSCTAWSDGSKNDATAYLWIPEKCVRVRGLLILCANVPEHGLVGHPAIREVCAANDLGIVWCTPTFMNFARQQPGQKKMAEEYKTSVAFLQQLLDGLAKTSGYEEVATAPWLPMGESGHLLMVDALVEAMPGRCIAGIWIKNNHLPPHNREVPALVVYGTAQEWSQDKTDIRTKWNDVAKSYAGILDQRKKTPDWPLSYVLDGHSGHFDCSERLTSYLAHYIDSATKARLSADGSPALNPVKISSGFVADLAAPEREAKPVAPAPATAPSALPWFFDRVSAAEAQTFAAINWQADTQLPVYLDAAGKVLPHDFNGIVNLKALAFEPDGLTFTVRGTLADTIPEGFLSAGEKLAQAPGAPVPEWLCGPIEPLGGDRFRIALDRVWLGGGATYLGLRHPGNSAIRGSIQPAGIDLRGALRNKDGKPQKITFAQLSDLRVGAAPVPLVATADSGLPVLFFVVAGPAIIRDNQLVLTPVPPRTRLPVTITVAAWQWGRATEPKIKMAEIVQQTIKLTAP